MAEDNVKAQMRKGILEYCILAILSRGDSYAPRIIAELKAAEMIVVEGTLYPILTRQKNAGLLTYRWEESPQVPPRKYYTLTEKGREALRTLDQAWIEMVQQYGVERIEGQPLFREVERIALEARFGAAQLFEPSRVGHDLRSAGVDVFHEIEVDVVIVIGNAVLQCEPDDDPLRFVGIGLVARDAGLVAGVERLPVVALEIVVSAVERADGGDERTERFAAVVVVAGGKSGDSYSCDEE